MPDLPHRRVAQRLRAEWPVAIVAAAAGMLIWTGLIGLDFGIHWDEKAQYHDVNQSIETGVLLSLDYHNYPSMTYVFAVAGQGTQVFRRLEVGPPLSPREFYLSARRLFLVAVALSGFWLYAALRLLVRRSAAVVGACAFLLSWQLGYHARWIAPDGLLIHATSLFLFVILLAWRAPPTSRLRYAPIVVAAIAATAKYQGAVFLLPAMMLLWLRPRPDRPLRQERLLAVAVPAGAFAALFLLWNPAMVLEPRAFYTDVAFEITHYRTTHGHFSGPARPYDVENPWTFAPLLVRYLLLPMPSYAPLIAVAVDGLAVIGALRLVRTSRHLAALVLVPMGIAFLYYCTLHVFIVRNFLFFLPVMAFLAALGVEQLLSWPAARRLPLPAVGFALVSVAMALSALHLHRSATTIPAAAEGTARELAAELQRRPGEIALSPGSRAMLAAHGHAPVAGPGVAEAQGLAVLQSEVNARHYWLRSWPSTGWRTFRTLGPEDVDYSFYATWEGADRVILLTRGQIETYLAPGSTEGPRTVR